MTTWGKEICLYIDNTNGDAFFYLQILLNEMDVFVL
jgi:hypothetical protein